MNKCPDFIVEIEPWSNLCMKTKQPRRTLCADCVGLTRYFEFCSFCQRVLQRTFGTADRGEELADEKWLKPESVIMKSKRRWAAMSTRRRQ